MAQVDLDLMNPKTNEARLTAAVELAARLSSCQIALVSSARLKEPVATFAMPDDHIGSNSTFPRLVDPITAKEEGYEFYCGIPLRSPDGSEIGRLVVLDSKSRTISQRDFDCLMLLSRITADMI